MKVLAIVILFAICEHKVESLESCEQCKDRWGYCNFFYDHCDRLTNQLLCPQTCGQCFGCRHNQVVSKRLLRTSYQNNELKCELSTCVDQYLPALCRIYKTKMFGCLMTGGNCRKTCDLCVPCVVPPTPVPCIPSCKDSYKLCGYWKAKKYCDPKYGYPHTREICKLSCGVCTFCSVEPFDKMLPPPS